MVDQGSEVLRLTWLGDATNEALACLLMRRGFTATAAGPGVEVFKGPHTTEDILDTLADAAVDETPPLDMLLADVKNLQPEKWDWALPDPLLRKAYASLYLNLDEALAWVRALPVPGPRSRARATSAMPVSKPCTARKRSLRYAAFRRRTARTRRRQRGRGRPKFSWHTLSRTT